MFFKKTDLKEFEKELNRLREDLFIQKCRIERLESDLDKRTTLVHSYCIDTTYSSIFKRQDISITKLLSLLLDKLGFKIELTPAIESSVRLIDTSVKGQNCEKEKKV